MIIKSHIEGVLGREDMPKISYLVVLMWRGIREVLRFALGKTLFFQNIDNI